jgi:uncharacterized protein YodC (DUF2158 family)
MVALALFAFSAECERCVGVAHPRVLQMTIFKPGHLVVLKSGGPVMTVDAVNTSIFDDNEITGIICVWFVGETLQRARFGRHVLEAVRTKPAARKRTLRQGEVTGDYKVVLDEMAAAMNAPADVEPDPAPVAAVALAVAETVVEPPPTPPVPKDVAA